MGLIIVTIVGTIMGWLVAIVVDRDERSGGRLCTLMGAIGAIGGALLIGDVPLIAGVSALQLLGALIGAIVAILVLCAGHTLLAREDSSQSLPTRRTGGTPATIRR